MTIEPSLSLDQGQFFERCFQSVADGSARVVKLFPSRRVVK